MSDFAHRLTLDRIRDGDRVNLIADEGERLAIAQRLGLEAIGRLEAEASIDRDGDRIRVRGRLQASVEQSCIVTGDPVAGLVDEPFDLLFVPEPSGGPFDEEVELSSEDCDVLFHDGAMIDVGQAVADSLALAVDPYPRSAGADARLKEAGVISEEEAGPFAALAQLRKSLSPEN